ncbi:MAG TPA: hypothetical protein VNV13_02550 [Steroidobacteraceae bacterium]|jgi:hypothetical protein|nr:hypothetical protein [Steroidobacteraceae bacterium]
MSNKLSATTAAILLAMLHGLSAYANPDGQSSTLAGGFTYAKHD